MKKAGYYRDPEELYKLISLGLTGRELSTFLFIELKYRLNGGKPIKIPAKFFREKLGSLSRVRLKQIRDGLIKRNLITVKSEGNGFSLTYSIQKDFTKWKALSPPLTVHKREKTEKALSPPLTGGDSSPLTVSPGLRIKTKDKEYKEDIPLLKKRIKMIEADILKKFPGGKNIDPHYELVTILEGLKKRLREAEQPEPKESKESKGTKESKAPKKSKPKKEKPALRKNGQPRMKPYARSKQWELEDPETLRKGPQSTN